MKKRHSPAVIRQQAQLILQDVHRTICVDCGDHLIATAWFEYCYLIARDFGVPFERGDAVLAECQKKDPSIASLDELILVDSFEMGRRLADTLREKKTPLAKAFGLHLGEFLLAAALVDVGIEKGWPAWLSYEQVRLLPDNPFWIDKAGRIYGYETARPEHFTQLGEVMDWNRGGQPPIGRPRDTGEFGSPEAFRFEITAVLRALRQAKRPLTQEEVASFIIDNNDMPIELDSVTRKIKRYCRRWRHHGCAWKGPAAGGCTREPT